MRSRPLSALRALGWPSWLVTLTLLALLCAILVYWSMILLVPRSPIAPASSHAGREALPELQLASQLFGASPGAAATAAASNIQVLGIVAAGRRGSAILAVDGKAPRPFAVGEALSPTQRLAEVRSNAVIVSGAGEALELPAPESPSIAVLTSGADQPQRAPRESPPAQIHGSSIAPRFAPGGPPPAVFAKPEAASDGRPGPAVGPGTPGPSVLPNGPSIVHGIVPVQPATTAPRQ
ncbi:MAG: hypothetical protein KJZ83_23510 [Burkholderiaceae bacterium]|nr:hypothetical protein [Burkholderiaceae bacterium]